MPVWLLAALLVMPAIFLSGGCTKENVITLEKNTIYTTEAYIYQAAKEGPAAIVLGGLHGDEPAGWLTAVRLRHLSVKTGTLIVIPKVNQAAIKLGVRTLPDIGDVNRLYPGRTDGLPGERLAAEIVSLIKKYNVVMLIDLHEAGNFYRFDPQSLGQTIIFGNNDQSALLALSAVDYVNQKIFEPYRHFTFVGRPVQGSSAYFAGTELGIAAFTIETSVAQLIDDRVEQQYQIVRYLLAMQGIVEEDDE